MKKDITGCFQRPYLIELQILITAFLLCIISWKTKSAVLKTIHSLYPTCLHVPPLRWRSEVSHPPIVGLIMPRWGSFQRRYTFGDEASEIRRNVNNYNSVAIRTKCDMQYNPVAPCRKPMNRLSEARLTWDLEQKQWSSLGPGLLESLSQDCMIKS